MKLIFLLLLVGVITVGGIEKKRYDDFRVYQVLIETAEQLDVFNNIDQISSHFDIWQRTSHIGGTMDILVPPHKLADFLQIVEDFNVQATLKISNVQTLIDNERPLTRADEFGWDDYRTLDEIFAWIEYLKTQYYYVFSIYSGSSTNGNQIGGAIIRKPAGRPAIFIEANTHAREWITSATATWIINELLTSTDPAVQYLVDNYEWWIVPVANPDGYIYSLETNRLWRKNRSQRGEICYGIDPDRNWDYMWSNENNNMCSETYPGRVALSELEAFGVRNMVQILFRRVKIFLSFHSYGQMILHPWCYTDEPIPDVDDLRRISEAAADKLKERYGTEYTVQSGNDHYAHSGTALDWAYGAEGINISLSYKFRDTGNYGFLLPATQIIPNAQEVFDSLLVLISEAENLGYL